MSSIIINYDDPDILETRVNWTSNGEVFIKQDEVRGFQHCVMLSPDAARQVIKALSAYLKTQGKSA